MNPFAERPIALSYAPIRVPGQFPRESVFRSVTLIVATVVFLFGVIAPACFGPGCVIGPADMVASDLRSRLTILQILAARGAACPSSYDDFLDHLYAADDPARDRYAADAGGTPNFFETIPDERDPNMILVRLRSGGPDRVRFSPDDVIAEQTIQWRTR